MASHIKIIGVLNLVFGILKLLAGVGLFLVFALVGGLAGFAASQSKAIAAQEKAMAAEDRVHREALREEAEEPPPAEDPDEAVVWEEEGTLAAEGDADVRGSEALSDEEAGMVAAGIMGVIGLLLGGGVALWGVLRILVGVGLMRLRGWARFGGVVLAILDLPNMPLGTALGIYALWALFSGEGAAAFRAAR